MYHSVEDVKNILNEKPNLREKLFCRGYLITDDRDISLTDYPFYDNWAEYQIYNYRILVHKDQHLYYGENESKRVILIGNAVNPFKMIYDENELIRDLLVCDNNDKYIDTINEFTGVFFVGIFEKDNFIFLTDPTEMLFASYGIIKSKLYISSHPQLIGDFCDLVRSRYAVELENYRFFKKYGTFFPGNITQFNDVKRVLTNHYYVYNGQNIEFKRFYPTKVLYTCSSREEYISVVKEVSRILHNTMICAAKKWKNAAISMTGGMDSKTTMSAANNRLDQIIELSPSKIFIMIGINDIAYDIPMSDITDNMNNICKKIHGELPNTEIYIQSVLPNEEKSYSDKIINLNEYYESLCYDNGFTFIDLYPEFINGDSINEDLYCDGTHINGAGYKIWIEEVKKYVN